MLMEHCHSNSTSRVGQEKDNFDLDYGHEKSAETLFEIGATTYLTAKMSPPTGANGTGETSVNQEVGAKRRKPQKTSKVAQHQPQNEDDDVLPMDQTQISLPPVHPEQPTMAETENSLPAPDSSDLEPEFPVRQAPLLEIGVVESGEDHTYKCPLCQEYLPSQKEFTMHIRAHNEVKPSPDPNDPTGQAKVYYCCLCGKMLSSFSSLDRHMLVHSGERPFSCLLCGQTFTTNGNMHRHKRTHGARDSHMVLDENEAAGIATPRRGGGRKRSLPPGPGGLGRGGKIAKQDGLNGTTPIRGALGAGRGRGGRTRKLAQQKSFGEEVGENQFEIGASPPTVIPPSSPMSFSQSNNHAEGFSCFVCKETFVSELSMESHILSMHPGDKVSCDECNFMCPNYSYLKLHRNMFHLVKHVGSLPCNNNNGGIRPLDFSSAQLHHPHIAAPSSLSSPPLTASSLLQLAAGPGGLCQNGKPQSAFMTQQQFIANSCASFLGPLVSSLATRNSVATSMESPTSVTFSSLTHSAISAAAEAAAAASMSAVCNIKPNNNNLLQQQGSKMLSSPNIPSTNLSQSNFYDKTNETINNGRDFADVQSIVSIARQCTSGFKVNTDSNDQDDDSQSESSSVHQFDNNHSSEGSSSVKGEDPLIRDMKLRGEFPCRLCSAVYPNLRALKGHNKEHLGKAPYNCNVGSCTYSSNDKSTLTRHMRTHTGEKPFECKLCNYGFTTKANCERHLKNKHGKTSRDAIRNSIIVHESEDGGPNGEERSSDEQFRCKVCKGTFSTSAKVISHAIKEHPAYANDVDHIFEEIKAKESLETDDDLSCPSMVPRANNFPMLNQLRPHLPSSTSPSGQLHSDNSCSSYNNDAPGPDAPLDLSRPSKEQPQVNKEVNFANLPVLKLQGKFPVMPPSMLDASSLAKLTPVTNCGTNAQAALAAAAGLLPANFPFMLPTTFPGASPMPNTLTSPFPFLLPPFANASNMAAAVSSLLPSVESLPVEIREKLQADMKQRLQQLQQFHSPLLATTPPSNVDAMRPAPPLGSASDIADYVNSVQRELLRKQAAEIKEQKEAAETLQHLSQVQTGTVPPSPASVTASAPPPSSFSSQQDGENNVNNKNENSNGQTSSQRDTEDDEANYKMVIKNGVLMKKQKQRRYRTERPYGCNYCSARFTLRSNMERHIKQQHPENWCQKPRGSRRNHSATVPVLAPQFQHNGDGEDEDEEEEEGVLDREGSTIDDDGEEDGLVIDEPATAHQDEEDFDEEENTADLVSVSKLLNSATSQSFQKYFDRSNEEEEEKANKEGSDLVLSNPSERKKSAYSAAPHKISCPYCTRKFPWTSSLNRHILTHTGQKPYKCRECPLWFTTKSNCDRHVIRKHGGGSGNNNNDQSFTARNAPDRPYKCQLCPSSTFSSRSNLKKHQFTRHQGGTIEPTDGGSSADDEDEEFEYDDEDDTAMTNGVHEIDEGVLNGEARFRCHICHHPVQVFSERRTAVAHLKSKHGPEYEELHARGEIAKAESCLRDADDDKSISCLFCSMTFESQPELRDHVEVGHGPEASAGVTPAANITPLFPPKAVVDDAQDVVADENKGKMKKKKSLMDKINQLSSSAVAAAANSSIQNIFSSPDHQ